ncbi:carbohydrate ABC transporter permease [Nocardiopsis sp. JB363]|uniref:carbohydrate ABC transporter permease n=1 Tax=Nocardiopsis sp. JB363 TaxID=1434837 RepID=UPI00097A66BC|nr:sugar ABC transporter permease [Nocardiopsis sp. JB363]SIO91055.1 Various polyols ABC transporter, permease component 1 [Nocardiopsis sp. JB363]
MASGALLRGNGAAGAGRPGGRPSRAPGRSRLRAWLYLLPALTVYAGFAIYSAGSTVWFSFLDWDGVQPPTWAGLANYTRVLTEPLLAEAILNGLILIVFFSLIPIAIGLLLTGLLLGRVRTGMTFFRTVFFLPQVLPLVAVGITWRWLYSDAGMVNQALEAVGLGAITRAWLGDYHFALIALGLIGTWCMSGLCMVLFMSGAQRIDPSLNEAAAIDGAGPLRRFRYVTLPGLRREVGIAAVITTIAALASFDLVFVTTNGGPAGQTNVPALLVYRLAFNEGTIGGAAALAVVLTLIVIVLVSAIRLLTREPK